MKTLFTVLLVTLLAVSAHADTCAKNLTGPFTPAQAVELCSSYGPGLTEGNGDFVIKLDSDLQRLFTFGASSDTALTLSYGDSGVTATQALTVGPSTADADDDATTCLAGGGAASDNSRGASVCAKGNESSAAGDLDLGAGGASNSRILLDAPAANGTVAIATAGQGIRWEVDANGDLLSSSSVGGNVTLRTTGKTVAIDSGTAASACRGTGTFNGTTAVTVSTTCAATGATVLVQPSSDPTGSTAAYCWFTNISNGVSFDVDCDQANDGTFHWIIIKEG